MSGMFETKSDKANRKLARTQKENKAKKKQKIVTITIVSLLALVAAVAIVINSSFIRRTVNVVTIDGVGFTTTEFEFFFNSQYLEYLNMMSQFGGFGDGGPNSRRPLSTQVFNHETGETWADYFTAIAFSRMSGLASLYNAATAAGFVLSDEQLDEIEQDILMLSFQAMMDHFPTTDSFLQQLYGNSINENEYRKIQKFIMTAVYYSEHVRESFTFTPDELKNFYTENKDSFDVFNYRTILLAHERLDIEDFANEEEYEAALETAKQEVRQKADLIVSEGFENAEAFVAMAQEEADSTASWIGAVLNRMGDNLDETFDEWLRNTSRQYGDVAAFDTATGTTIIYFVSRDDNSYKTVAMRQILILRDTVDPAEYPGGIDDPDYHAAVELSETAARERAELVNSLFIAAGSTEDALLSLIAEHSDDTTEGGFYEDITKFAYNSANIRTMKVVPELEEWLFDESRAIGDSELIYTSDFGFHLVYFMGFGKPFFEVIADDKLRTEEHDEWSDNLPQGQPVKHAAFILVHV